MISRILWRLSLYISMLASLLIVLYIAGISPKAVIQAALLAMTPLALAAAGEAINERAGMVNIGIEGIFAISAIAGVYAAEIFGNGYIGLLVGGLAGASIGLIMSLIAIYGRADQVIIGMGLNIVALGLTPFLLRAVWGFPGLHLPPREVLIHRIDIYGFQLSVVTIVAILASIALYLILNRTYLGLWIKASGESPEALDAAGHSVNGIRIAAYIMGGFLAGVGGAFMPLDFFGAITKEFTAGRGFIALACVISSNLDPLRSLGFALIFGLADSLAPAIAVTPGMKERIPYQFILSLPYIVTLLVVAIAVKGRRLPRALGIPYSRE
jgi:simple sugar transport system permease protein